jgi:uncharacterized protein (TIGR02453 family)
MAAEATETVERFEGFSDDAVQFFLELQAEQSRSWFKAHQDDFMRLCRRPLELLVEELRENLVDVYPTIRESEPHYFRIQRDTRFAKDKAPYKTNVAADMSIRPPREGEEGHSIPGMYLSFGLEGEFVGIGAWHMEPEALARYRAVIDDGRTGSEIQRLVDQLLARGCTLSSWEGLKRVPAPYPQDHPRAELLKRKGLAIVAQPRQDVTASRAMLDWAEVELRAAAPLMNLLDRRLNDA